MFWALYVSSPTLVVSATSIPEPEWLNQTVHSLVSALVLVELLLTHHRRPPLLHSLPSMAGFVFSYLALLFYVGLCRDHWSYGVLAKLDTARRSLFVFAVVLLFLSLAGCLQLLHRLCWPTRRVQRFLYGFDPTHAKLHVSTVRQESLQQPQPFP